MYKWASGYIVPQHPHIYIFLSSPANNLEVFFMFPQAKNRQEGKAQGLTLQADTNCQPYELNQDT